MRLAAALVLVSCSLSAALRIQPISVRAGAAASRKASSQAKAAFLAAMCSAQLFAGVAQADQYGPVQAGYPNLPAVIVETSEASYPILRTLPADKFPPFASKVADIVLLIKPEKLAKSVDLGIDAYLSVPPEQVDTFNAALKETFGGLKTDSCDLVPLPNAALVHKFQSSNAFSQVAPPSCRDRPTERGVALGNPSKTWSFALGTGGPRADQSVQRQVGRLDGPATQDGQRDLPPLCRRP